MPRHTQAHIKKNTTQEHKRREHQNQIQSTKWVGWEGANLCCWIRVCTCSKLPGQHAKPSTPTSIPNRQGCNGVTFPFRYLHTRLKIPTHRPHSKFKRSWHYHQAVQEASMPPNKPRKFSSKHACTCVFMHLRGNIGNHHGDSL